MGMLSAARLRLYHLLFDQNRRSGRRFEGLCGLFALLSVVVIFVESGLGTQYHLTLDEWHIFVWLELLVTAVFTLEYLLRIATWPNPLHYIFSFWGFIDLATILPLYVMWLWPEISLNYVFAWRAMRAIRALRILKLLRFMPSLNVFWRAIVSARHQLILFYSFIAIVMVIFGSLMYLIEGPEYGLLGHCDHHHRWLRGYYAAHAAGPHPGLHSHPDRLLHYCHSDRAYHHPYDQRPEPAAPAAGMPAVPAGRA